MNLCPALRRPISTSVESILASGADFSSSRLAAWRAGKADSVVMGEHSFTRSLAAPGALRKVCGVGKGNAA